MTDCYPYGLNEGRTTFFYLGEMGTREQCDAWVLESFERKPPVVDHTSDPAHFDE